MTHVWTWLKQLKWSNLWAQFLLAPGTARPRLILVAWQLWLMVAAWLGQLSFGWRGACIALGLAWLSHELAFKWYAEHVAGLQEPDQYPNAKPYTMPCYVPTIERWCGPFGSDPGNKKEG